MPSRRISAPDALAPIQELSVQPYSSYNSDNINMLTRIVSGERNKDFIVNGLDVFGYNRVESEQLDTPETIGGDFPSQSSFDNYWNGTNFNWDSITGKAVAIIQSPATNSISTLASSVELGIENLGYYYKITFDLTNSPKQLYVTLGSEIRSYDHPSKGSFTLYLQLNNENGSDRILTINAVLDQRDDYTDQLCYIDNVTLTKVLNMGSNIEPISERFNQDNSAELDHEDLPLHLLHPHEECFVSNGVAIKDETMLNMLGVNSNLPVSELEYGNSESWIHNDPYDSSDFSGDTLIWRLDVATGSSDYVSSTFDSNGKLTDSNAPLDDGEDVTYVRKVVGDLNQIETIDLSSVQAQVKWAYVCIYYSYFKNPEPNKAYIGLIREDTLNDVRYGEDYLPIAKLRFIDADTVDAILYYPDRVDWGYIDATRMTYTHLNQLKHWTNRPVNVSLALDLLASKIYNFKGMLYFQTHKDFTNWIGADANTDDKYLLSHGGNGIIGTGHGPVDYLQWINGSDPDNSYDLCAYILESNSFWRSQILSDGVLTDITIESTGVGLDDGTYTDLPIIGKREGVTDSSSNTMLGQGYTATVSVTVTGGIITDATITDGGTGYIDTVYVDLTSISGSATEAGWITLKTSNPELYNYKLRILWSELQQKRFEVNWTNIQSGQWPQGTPPTNWSYWNGTSWDDSPTVMISWLEAKEKWPHEYYGEKCTGPGNFTKINPYNPEGLGTVPGPDSSLDDIKFNKFLRSDGTWQVTGKSVLVFENYEEFATWYKNDSYEWTDEDSTEFTITYNDNGSTSGSVPADQTKTIDVDLTLRSNTGLLDKTYYTFLGWNTRADGSGTSYNEGANFTVNANTTLYANWAIESWTLSYDKNGGSGTDISNESQVKDGGDPIVVSDESDWTNIGYSFAGWNTEAGGGGDSYNPGEEINLISYNSNIILYAQWKIVYEITYDANGATSGTVPTPNPQIKIHDIDATLYTNSGSLAKSDQVLLGWNTANDGSGTRYNTGATYSNNSSITLYAEWGTPFKLRISIIDESSPYVGSDYGITDAWTTDVSHYNTYYATVADLDANKALVLNVHVTKGIDLIKSPAAVIPSSCEHYQMVTRPAWNGYTQGEFYTEIKAAITSIWGKNAFELMTDLYVLYDVSGSMVASTTGDARSYLKAFCIRNGINYWEDDRPGERWLFWIVSDYTTYPSGH